MLLFAAYCHWFFSHSFFNSRKKTHEKRKYKSNLSALLSRDTFCTLLSIIYRQRNDIFVGTSGYIIANKSLSKEATLTHAKCAKLCIIENHSSSMSTTAAHNTSFILTDRFLIFIFSRKDKLLFAVLYRISNYRHEEVIKSYHSDQ